MTEPAQRVTQEQAAAIFRRAAEIEAARGDTDATFDLATVEQAALEAGLSAGAVRQAALEVRASASVTPAPTRALTLGSRTDTISRVVAGDADQVHAALSRWLEGQRMRVRRRLGGRSTWEKATGLTAAVMRATDVTHRIRLQEVTGLVVEVADVGDGRAHVQVEVDFRELLNGYLGGLGASVGVAAAIGGAIAGGFGAELGPVLGASFGASATGIGAFLGLRGSYRSKKASALDGIEGFLDELEQQRPNRSTEPRRRR